MRAYSGLDRTGRCVTLLHTVNPSTVTSGTREWWDGRARYCLSGSSDTDRIALHLPEKGLKL